MRSITCTETGLTDGTQCTVCNTTIIAQAIVDALGHTEATVEGKSPTCTETGLTDGVKCTVCGETLTEQEEIAALGHTEETIEGKEPTCTEDGTKTASCDNGCGTLDTIPNTGFAQGHSWNDATTESPKTCEVCGATEGEKLPEPTPAPDTEVTPEVDDTPEKNHDECIAKNAFEEFINMIINFIRSILGLPEICYCGEEY